MHTKHNIICCRVAGGITPSPVTLCTAEYTDDWNSDLVSLTFTLVELIATEGDLSKLRDRLAALTPAREEDDDEGDGIQRVHRRRRTTSELVIDTTNDPRFTTMVDAEHYTIMTGSQVDDQGTDARIGRLVLLSNLKTLLARKLLKFNPADHWPDVQAALTGATAKPAPVETDGLLVTETTQHDDLVIAIGLACWRATEWPPGGQSEELDYSELHRAVI